MRGAASVNVHMKGCADCVRSTAASAETDAVQCTLAECVRAVSSSFAVDHATVARRIASLEQSLELKLADHRPRAYVLTADGERIADRGQRMQAESFAVAASR
jgi:hypothetical protein